MEDPASLARCVNEKQELYLGGGSSREVVPKKKRDQLERRSGQTHTERMALALLIQLTEKINGLAGGRSQGKAWGMETPRE